MSPKSYTGDVICRPSQFLGDFPQELVEECLRRLCWKRATAIRKNLAIIDESDVQVVDYAYGARRVMLMMAENFLQVS